MKQKRSIAGFGLNFVEKSLEEKVNAWEIVEAVDELFRDNGVEPITWVIRETGSGDDRTAIIEPHFPADCFPEATIIWNFAIRELEQSVVELVTERKVD